MDNKHIEFLFHGESTEVLKGLEDNSIDSVVCDPPYGLSKEPDISKVILEWVNGDDSFVPDGKGFMSKEWDGFVPPPSLWKEVYRVLKPGGHALVFAGTRTQDLMTISLRLAGFEVRDVIEWIYFSGFPKSHDVSKAFDRRNGRNYPDDVFRDYLKERAKAVGLTGAQVDRELGTNGMWGHYVGRSQPAFPTVDAWQRMKPLLNLDNRYDEIIYRAEAEREKVGEKPWTNSANHFIPGKDHTERINMDITAPATNLAKQWDGWGTSTKPSHEPVIVVSKPKTVEDILDEKLKEVANCLSLFVKIAVQNSTLNLQDYVEELDFARNRVEPKNNIQDVLSEVTDTSQLKALMENINWSTALSCLITLGDRLKNGNTSTTEMVLNTIIELKTLKYFQSLTTLESIIKDATSRSGERMNAETAAGLLNEELSRLSEILALPVPENATSKQEGKDSFHKHEPIIVVRKPLIDADTGRKLTVADCVEKYGTGAINIDASRIATDDSLDRPQGETSYMADNTTSTGYTRNTRSYVTGDYVGSVKGRFPANCITLDSDEFYSKYFNVSPAELSKKASKKDRNSDWQGEDISKEVITWEDVVLTEELEELNRLRKVISEDITQGTGRHVWSTLLFGKNITEEKFRKAIKSTTSTELSTTTESKTCDLLTLLLTNEYTPAVIRTITANGLNLAENAENINRLKQSITNEKVEYRLGVASAVLGTLLKIKEKGKLGNVHSTVKPTDLMTWLVRLITPEGGTVLDPFAGSGSTLVAAKREGFGFIGVELTEEYIPIIEARTGTKAETSEGQAIR